MTDAIDETGTADRLIDANVQKLFPNSVPDDPDIRDLALRLNAAKGSGKSQAEIAREITGEAISNDPIAQALLARIRMLRNRGKLNL